MGISEHHVEGKLLGPGDCLGVAGEGAPQPSSRMDGDVSGGAHTAVGAWGC